MKIYGPESILFIPKNNSLLPWLDLLVKKNKNNSLPDNVII